MANNAVSWSTELYRIFGVDPTTFVPSNEAVHQLIHPADREQHLVSVQRALQGCPVAPFESRIIRPSGEERVVLASGFDVDRDAAGNVRTLFGAILDITERKRMQRDLEQAHGDLQRLVAAQDRVQEQERQRIARELHDDLQQSLAGIMLEAAAARAGPPVDDASDQALARIQRITAQIVRSTRQIIRDLRPQALDELGLKAALDDLARQFSQRSGVACMLHASALEGATEALVAPLATSLYRIAQEALNNVARHAHARRVRIELAVVSPGSVRLQVSDDGVGMPIGSPQRDDTFGLLGMRERARAAGGCLSISSQPGAGTTVTAEIPTRPAAPVA